MFDSAILDVAIGLAFIVFLVSLLVSAVSEALSGWFKWRSAHLWDGLEHLLQSADARNELYNHPLIKGLARVNVTSPQWNKGRNGPSYIPSRTFALAVIDILRRPHRVVSDLERRLQTAIDDATHDPSTVFAAVDRIVRETAGAEIPDRIKKDMYALRTRVLPPVDMAVLAGLKQQVRAQLDSMSDAERSLVAAKVSRWLAQPADAAANYVDLRASLTAAIDSLPFAGATSTAEQLRTALDAIVQQFAHGRPEDAVRDLQAFLQDAPKRWLAEANASLQNTLSPLLHEAADDVDRFRENIEIWFNDGMDRVSGWYKRYTSYVQATVALVLAIFMNIDALQITRTLWREPTLRQSLVANAESIAHTASPALQPPSTETRGTPAAATTKAIDASLSVARLFPEGVALATITLPDPAPEGASVVAARQSADVFVGETNNDISKTQVTISPAVGDTEVEFFVKGGPVTEPTLARIKVTAGGLGGLPELEVNPTVVVTPTDGFAALQKQIGGLGLPIGWSCPTDTGSSVGTNLATTIGGPFWCTIPPGNSGRRWTSVSWLGTNKGNILGILSTMIFGWLITAAAASLGAPFWFDMLKRVVSVRSSGKAPEERPLSPKEVSQPREPGQRPKDADLLNALKG